MLKNIEENFGQGSVATCMLNFTICATRHTLLDDRNLENVMDRTCTYHTWDTKEKKFKKS
jgi:hypothetical protein